MPEAPDLAVLLPSWLRTLRAERKSPATVASYSIGVERYLAWCATHTLPPVLTRRQVTSYVDSLLADGAAATTARSRLTSLRRFVAWLIDEDELEADPLLGIKAPTIDAHVVEPLTDAELKAMLKTCRTKGLRDLRDLALLRLMVETGLRASEAAGLLLADINLDAGTAIVRRGKGGKGRVVPYGPQTAQALDRYMRARRTHRRADTPGLWLGVSGRGFGYTALHHTLAKRADEAGIDGFHPHKLRHTAAHRWLAAGGSEGGLLAVAGWKDRRMLDRYSAAHASQRAVEESAGLNLGDW